MTLIAELHRLPDSWAYVAVSGQKRPYQPNWPTQPLDKSALITEIKSGRAKAIGVCCGTPSGGLLFLDHDGKSAANILDDWNCPISSLPHSWIVTSGRDNHFQIIFRIPEHYWPLIATRKYKTNINNEQIELRWDGSQSVVAGAHPKTDGYYWLQNHAPEDCDIAEAPLILIEKMLKTISTTPLVQYKSSKDTLRARAYLAALNVNRADDYDDWLTIGMALHSIGDDSLLDDWEHWSTQSTKHKPSDCQRKWNSFKKSGITIATLGDMANKDKQPPKIITKPEKLEAIELLAYLRSAYKDIRFNIFTQKIEIKQKVIDGIDRFYLQLAEMGYKVNKELAIDCLVQVANENLYDPVRIYLEHVANTINPTYIDRLATTYLRPLDISSAKPTIYDEMLKCTLIAAVARCLDPGCKFDNACVIMGDQGAQKSSFWGCLGGEFYSDALGDISSKDDIMVLHRSWLMEWAELDRITNLRHAGQVKNFLSQAVDYFRVPYGKTVEHFPRRGIIVGTTNKTTGFLVDETGNRRFWVIPTTKTQQDQIDTTSLKLERDAIWSAAVHAYHNKQPTHLSAEAENKVFDENISYVVESPWRTIIQDYLVARRKVDLLTTEELLTEAVMKPIERQTRSDQMQISQILKNLGWIAKRETSGRRRRYYVQP